MPERLLSLLACLRDPQTGCPWDRKQTPLSLCAGIVDETYELVEAIEHGQPAQVADELGDLLFQLMFVVSLYSETGQFTLDDVIKGIEAKMIRRHPHVFGDESLKTASQVLERWEQIKLTEKQTGHPLDSVPKTLPALAQSRRLYGKAKRLGWLDDETHTDLTELFNQVMQNKRSDDYARLLFNLVVWGMEHELNAEELLRAANFAFKEKIKEAHPLAD